MHLSRVFVWLSVASLASVVLGAPMAVPVDDEDSLVARESEYIDDLSLRALTQAQIGQRASATLQKQQARKTAKATRAPANKAKAVAQKKAADTRKAAAKAAKVKPTKMTPAQVKAQKLANNPAKAARQRNHAAAAANAGKTKAAKKAKQTARRAANRKAGKPKGPAGVQGARKARVATRKADNEARKKALATARAKLDKGPKLSRPDRKKALKAAVPPKPRPVNADKAAVTQHIKDSAQKMKTMTGIPSRNHVFKHPTIPEQRTGKDVRKAVMNSHLHNGAPIGAATNPRTGAPIKPMPKHFGNHPNAGAPHAQPIPGGPRGGRSGMSEYPVKSGGAGWQGEKDKGAVRVITDNTRNVFHGVVTHPTKGSANGNDYHKMT